MLQVPALSAPVLPAPVVLSVIHAVLSQIRICRNLRVLSANFLGPDLYLCYSNRFLHLCETLASIQFKIKSHLDLLVTGLVKNL